MLYDQTYVWQEYVTICRIIGKWESDIKMDNLARKVSYATHRFYSKDGSVYTWKEKQQSELTLDENDIEALRASILSKTDNALQNDISGNGMPMGVKIPIAQEKLDSFLSFILNFLQMKEPTIEISDHADDRLLDDIINGEEHIDFRGWLSNEDINQCVCSINKVTGARLTIDKRTLNDPEIRFNSSIALQVIGTKADGESGTLAIAILETNKIYIITLL